MTPNGVRASEEPDRSDVADANGKWNSHSENLWSSFLKQTVCSCRLT